MQPKDRRLVTEQNLENHTVAELAPLRENLENTTSRLSAVEVMAGLEPGEVTDAQTANLVHQPGSDTHQAIDAVTAQNIRTADTETRTAFVQSVHETVGAEPGAWQPYRVGESLAASLDMQMGITKLVILGDSTTNDPWDWPRRALDSLMLKYSGLHVEESVWSSNAYPTPTVLQAGDHFEPGGVSVVIDDEFNRTGTLPGSTPAVGGTWEGAEWTLDGTNALAPSSTGRVLSEGVAGEATTLARGVRIDTSESVGGRQFDLYSHYVDTNNHLVLSVSIGSSGTQVARIYARVDGSPNQIAVTSDIGLPASTVNHIDISMTLDGTGVSATIGPTTIEGTLNSAQAATLVQGAQYGFGRGIPENSNAITVNAFTVTLLNPTSSSGWGLQVWNGGSAGSDLSWQRARLPEILGPTAPDIVVIASSHNYGTTTPEAYIADVTATVDAITALYPDVEIIASGQNPQYEGTSTTPAGVAAHAARIAALRVEAGRKGWGYLPVYERFVSQPDGGRIWVEGDGVHPKGSLPSQYPGYQLWADVFTDYLDDMRLRSL